MAKKKSNKHVYLVSGWTNLREDIKVLRRHYYYDLGKGNEPVNIKLKDYSEWLESLKKIENVGTRKYWYNNLKDSLPPFNLRNGKITPKNPLKIIVAEQKVERSSADFNSLLLYYLGVIKINKKTKKLIDNAYYENYERNIALDDVDLISGNYEGVDGLGLSKGRGKIDKKRFLFEEYFLKKYSAKNIIEGRGDWWSASPIDYLRAYTSNPLVGVPEHCKILDGKKALSELRRRGLDYLIPFFKQVVSKYERKKI